MLDGAFHMNNTVRLNCLEEEWKQAHKDSDMYSIYDGTK